MTAGSHLLPLLVLATSLVTAVAIFALPEARHGWRSTFNLTGALAKLALVAVIFVGVLRGEHFEARIPFLPGAELVLRADFLALLFVSLSAVLWLVTTVYAIGYLEGAPHRSRFFGFFSLCVTATMGIALAGNLLTFLVFYEMLTVVTYPLVVHRGTGAALAAGRTYLLYTLGGGVAFLLGAAWLQTLAGAADFVPGGFVASLVEEHRAALVAIFALLIAGMGVKAALVPLHGWLPVAMVAPAPVSALLHAVAVVKAGAYGIVRVVHDVFGIETAASLGALAPVGAIAAATIVYGSIRALAQDDLKRRLAYSTVSQLSYITLGAVLVGPLATLGGLVHLVHQGIMKITLFFCAGVAAETAGVHRVSEMAGLGRRLPLTMTAFTVAAFGMIGVPPLAGFVTKWYLGLGSLEGGEGWVVAVLVTSSALNAAYFLPVIRTAWFGTPAHPWPERPGGGGLEAPAMLLFPLLATALLVILAGLLAAAPLSPLGIAGMAVEELYPP